MIRSRLRIRSVSLCLAYLILLATCDPGGNDISNESTVQIQVLLALTKSLNPTARATPFEVTEVLLNVSAPDMITIESSLNLSQGIASGIVMVPKGIARTFQIEGQDALGIVQFEASVTRDILEDAETIATGVTWIAPAPAEITLSNITPFSVDVHWLSLPDPDIAYYRVLLATVPDLNPSIEAHVVDDVTDPANSVQITGLDPVTTYYISIIPVDTEDLFQTDFPVFTFTTIASIYLLAYDDGSVEEDAVAFFSWLTVKFDALQYPAKIDSFDIWLIDRNGNGSDAAVLIWDENGSQTIFTDHRWVTGSGWESFVPDWATEISDGSVNGSFHIGVDFGASVHVSRIPAIGADTSSTYQKGRSWFRSSSGDWSPASDVGPAWNFMIRAHIELLPSSQVITVVRQ